MEGCYGHHELPVWSLVKVKDNYIPSRKKKEFK